MSLTIHEASPDDAATIHRLIQALAEYEREPDAAEVTPEILRTQMSAESPPFRCLVAEWDGIPAGMALFFQTYSTWTGRPGLYLEDLFVEEEHRGRSIGKALMEHLARRAVAEGCGRFEWSLLDWTEPAIGFYKRLGAVPQDEWTVYRLAGDALARVGSAPDNA
jgi:GNAT superfamily N-acetyltransferase